MSKFLTVVMLSAVAMSLQAQTYERRASNLGGGNPGQGRCVVEVVVDGGAQVEIRGDNASLRNLQGQPPRWTRFECTSAMPSNAPNFHFAGIDGRGKMQLIQAPQNGGPAVIRIDDPNNGSEGYTFEITWGNEMVRGGGPGGPPSPLPPPMGRRILTDDAVRLCQDRVRQQAMRQFRLGDVHFQRTSMDNNPGRNDWVTGFFDSAARGGRPQNYSFSCSVNFDNGQVRSAEIHPMPPGREGFGDAASGRTIQACEASVEDRLTRDGYRRADFGSVSFDDRPGRNDWINGSVTVQDRGRPAWFDFSCQVDSRQGTVRSVNVDRRQ